MHEVTPAQSTADFLGLSLKKNKLRISPIRIWRTRLAIEYILKKRVVSPAALEIVIGHVVWLMMARREVLCVLCYVYKHIRCLPRFTAIPISDAVASELRAIIGILPLCVADLSRVWHPTVHASDASPFGVGVCYLECNAEQVGEIGRQAEKLRYQLSCTGARSSALGSTAVKPQVRPSSVPSASVKQAGVVLHKATAISIAKQFVELPAGICMHAEWRVVIGRRHGHHEHITRTEGRTLMLAALHAARSANGLNKKHFVARR